MPISKLKKHPDYSKFINGKRMKFQSDGYSLLNTNL